MTPAAVQQKEAQHRKSAVLHYMINIKLAKQTNNNKKREMVTKLVQAQ